MKLALFAASVLTLSLATMPSVQAEQKVNPWKQCGIGAMIFDDNAGQDHEHLSHTLA